MIRTLIDEVKAYEEGIKPIIPEHYRIHDLEVQRNRLMQRSVLNAPAVIYGWVYEVAYRKARKQDRHMIRFVDETYRAWFRKALDPTNPESLHARHKQWRTKRKSYQARLSNEYNKLLVRSNEFQGYFLIWGQKPEDCNMWLFCNASKRGYRYEHWPEFWPQSLSFWGMPLAFHDPDVYKFPGRCPRDEYHSYLMTMALCGWTKSPEIDKEIDEYVFELEKLNVDINPLIEIYYGSIMWEFIFSEMMRRVKAALHDKSYTTNRLDLTSREYWNPCPAFSEDIRGCWDFSVWKVKNMGREEATSWKYNFRCLLDSKNSAYSTPGACHSFHPDNLRLFSERSVKYRQFRAR